MIIFVTGKCEVSSQRAGNKLGSTVHVDDSNDKLPSTDQINISQVSI